MRSTFNIRKMLKTINLTRRIKDINYKNIFIPLFTFIGSIYTINKFFLNNSKNLFCLNEKAHLYSNNGFLKYSISNTPNIFIIYDESNELQIEMSQAIFETLNKFYLNEINHKANLNSENKIKLSKICLNDSSD